MFKAATLADASAFADPDAFSSPFNPSICVLSEAIWPLRLAITPSCCDTCFCSLSTCALHWLSLAETDAEAEAEADADC